MTRGTSPAIRRALLIHALSTLVVTAVVAAAASVLSFWTAANAARASAGSAAEVVAHAVADHLEAVDTRSAPPQTRERILAELRMFIDAGVIERAKVWQIDGDHAVVVYSDEPRNVGVRRPFDPGLAARLDRGEVVVLDVPDDPEHQYETGRGELLEAFIAYTDATGNPMRLELYLPSALSGNLRSLLLATLAPALLGTLALSAVALPLALRLARRVETREAERRQLLQAALSASDRERHRLASQLHDGVIQDLASLGLTLSQLGERAARYDPGRAATLSRATDLIDDEITELRNLLAGFAPPAFDGSIELALRRLARELASPRVDVQLKVEHPVTASPQTTALAYRIARELARNAVEHSGADRVVISVARHFDEVLLDVSDNGTGFDTTGPLPDGHLGLSLVRQAAQDTGGQFDLRSDAGGTRVTVRLVDTR